MLLKINNTFFHRDLKPENILISANSENSLIIKSNSPTDLIII